MDLVEEVQFWNEPAGSGVFNFFFSSTSPPYHLTDAFSLGGIPYLLPSTHALLDQLEPSAVLGFGSDNGVGFGSSLVVDEINCFGSKTQPWLSAQLPLWTILSLTPPLPSI
jgi:hypothetical protein